MSERFPDSLQGDHDATWSRSDYSVQQAKSVRTEMTKHESLKDVLLFDNDVGTSDQCWGRLIWVYFVLF